MGMTWREYQLRKLGYERNRKITAYVTRDIVYHSLVATGAIDPRKTSINSFRPLEGSKVVKASDKAKVSYEAAMKEYLNEVKTRNGEE
ncbi:hypothetical protein ATB97_10945 [Elizabethkingia bruuniana]|nr:hypothetical protein AYC65_20100 [Elizabethkingia bruuniana]KGO09341.1 hypothetical protein KS04_14965 [Elizabethkingia miricola]KUY23885.1 hypothetical protein ATB97_10945 [Elizabethkingia bruuniana]OPB61523.1 hypothetical protein BAY12_13675 [Elizabethkingia bruuniana]